MAQLVEQSPPTPEIRGSNPVIGKLLSNICLLSTVLKDENKEKEAGNGPFKKKDVCLRNRLKEMTSILLLL